MSKQKSVLFSEFFVLLENNRNLDKLSLKIFGNCLTMRKSVSYKVCSNKSKLAAIFPFFFVYRVESFLVKAKKEVVLYLLWEIFTL